MKFSPVSPFCPIVSNQALRGRHDGTTGDDEPVPSSEKCGRLAFATSWQDCFTAAYTVCRSWPVRIRTVFALTLGLYSPADAQPGLGTGQVAGTVIDHATGAYLEGAEVRVEGTALQAFTDRAGRFEFGGVTAGEARLTVSYPGLPSGASVVEVTAGRTATTAVRLGGEVVRLDAFQVSGTREGMAKAIALQKASDGSRIVADCAVPAAVQPLQRADREHAKRLPAQRAGLPRPEA